MARAGYIVESGQVGLQSHAGKSKQASVYLRIDRVTVGFHWFVRRHTCQDFGFPRICRLLYARLACLHYIIRVGPVHI